ncbi:MAG: FixH family protein, partial [ANME-2 cluster archaeon]|nr:FixH family protein [ANME-2 cluster archaeon]
LFAAATDQNLMNPEIRHPLKKYASNLTVFDIDNNLDITSNCTVANDELFIPTECIGPINVDETRLFNVSYDAPKPDISPSVNKTEYNRDDIVLISASINFEGAPVTDANVSAVLSNSTLPEIGEVTLTHTGSGVYTGTYVIPANTSLGAYTVSVEAYSETLNLDNETVGYTVRMLNASLDAGGPYIVDSNATVFGYIYNMANGSPING